MKVKSFHVSNNFKEIFCVSPIIGFMKFRLFEDHAGNAIGINIIGYVISGTTMNTNITARKQILLPEPCPM